MPDVEGINMLEEHNHPSNHRSGEEGMNMVGIHDGVGGYGYVRGAPDEGAIGG
jgi:hypothetical protein